jgi:hypothetical protein
MSAPDWDSARAHAERIRELLREHAGAPEAEAARGAIELAHEHAHAVLAGDAGAPDDYAELAWVKTHLDPSAKPLPTEFGTIVSGGGGLFGLRKYEKFDPGWMETLAEYLAHLATPKPPFGASPRVIDIPDDASLAIVGDWATGYWQGGSTAASKVAALAQLADYAIHLGDTYYAGSKTQVPANLGLFPSGARGRFALPGNHEMYPKGVPFFAQLAAQFPLQGGSSCFALRSRSWLVLALDTAYWASDLYLQGTLGPPDNAQRRFAAEQLAQRGARRVMLLTHHPPFDLTAMKRRGLDGEVAKLFAGSGPDYWAFGHIHGAARYAPQSAPYRARLVGHGAIPFGAARELARNALAEWYETVSAKDPVYPERVTNGFLRLDFEGAECRESLVAEDGSVRWRGTF